MEGPTVSEPKSPTLRYGWLPYHLIQTFFLFHEKRYESFHIPVGRLDFLPNIVPPVLSLVLRSVVLASIAFRGRQRIHSLGWLQSVGESVSVGGVVVEIGSIFGLIQGRLAIVGWFFRSIALFYLNYLIGIIPAASSILEDGSRLIWSILLPWGVLLPALDPDQPWQTAHYLVLGLVVELNLGGVTFVALNRWWLTSR